jgi:predicted GNAT family acetyltransferase
MERNQQTMVSLIGTEQVFGELASSATGAADVGTATVRDNREAGAYELEIDGRTAAGLLYKETGTRVTLLATSVFPEFRGRGIAGKLLGSVLVLLRAEGRTVSLTCPFAAAFVHSHPEYADVVDPTFPGTAHSSTPGRMH